MSASNSVAFHKRKSPPKGKLPSIQSDNLECRPIEINDEPSLSSVASLPTQPTSPTLPFDHIDSISERFNIYIRANEPSAIFCELFANREKAARIEVLDRILPTLVQTLKMSLRHPLFKLRSAAQLTSAVLTAFIRFEVDVTQAQLFHSPEILQMVALQLKRLPRVPIAFFILLRDFEWLEGQDRLDRINFYAAYKAILMISSTAARVNVLTILYNNFGSSALDATRLPQRIFRDSPELNICYYLISRGFDPAAYPTIYTKCRFPKHHPKWDFFADTFGHREIEEFLQSDRMILPQQDRKKEFKFPFARAPLKKRLWNVFTQAFGEEVIQAHRLDANN